MNRNNTRQIFYDALFRNNSLLTLLLGSCLALAVTTNAKTAFWFGAVNMAVMLVCCIIASATKRFVPDMVRIPCIALVVCTVVYLATLIIKVSMPGLFAVVGAYMPLLAASDLVFGHSEFFSRKNSIIKSAVNALGGALGYWLVLMILSILREFFACGTFLGIDIYTHVFPPMTVFKLIPGGLCLLAFLAAARNAIVSSLAKLSENSEQKGEDKQ